MLVLVPAFRSMFSEHDRFLGHFRRYRVAELGQLALAAGIRKRGAGYLFPSLLAVRSAAVIGERFLGRTGPGKARGVSVWRGGKARNIPVVRPSRVGERTCVASCPQWGSRPGVDSMDALSSTVIVVPCFNEEGRFCAEAFLRALRQHAEVTFFFVNDGSGDRTGEVLAELSAAVPDRVRCLTLSRNRGKAEAIRQGILEASRNGAEIVGYWDADLAAPLENLKELLAAAADPETRVVMGSRVRMLGRKIERRPLRHYLGRVFATAASMVLGLHVYDTQCGAKLFRRTAALETCFSEPFWSRWIFDVEILARLRVLDLAQNGGPEPRGWVEVPLRQWHDVPGSRMRPSAYCKAPFELAQIALRSRWRRRHQGALREELHRAQYPCQKSDGQSRG